MRYALRVDTHCPYTVVVATMANKKALFVTLVDHVPLI